MSTRFYDVLVLFIVIYVIKDLTLERKEKQSYGKKDIYFRICHRRTP